MAGITAAELLAALRQLHLLEPPHLDELTQGLNGQNAEPRALAQWLIERAWLTPYQANQLLQGHGPDLLLGSYVLLERLGEGGMGQVFKARNWKLNQTVTLKRIRKERLDSADALRRFQREIRAAAQLDHPHIVRALDADEVGGHHLFVMEYVEGIDLSRLVKQHGPPPVALACQYIRQAALGLQHAHEKGLVHRDIKPANLLLTAKPNAGGVRVVKLLDMGLARFTSASEEDDSGSTLTREGLVMGTPDFMAPEQARESHTVDIRADLYSLGCTLYFLLTGRVPFPGGALMEKLLRHQMEQPTPIEMLRPEVPEAVTAVVYGLMAKRPEDRFQTPAELAEHLQSLLTGQSALSKPAARPAPRAPEQTNELEGNSTFWAAVVAEEAAAAPALTGTGLDSRWLLVAGGAVAVVLVLGMVLALLFGRGKRTGPTVAEKPAPKESKRDDSPRIVDDPPQKRNGDRPPVIPVRKAALRDVYPLHRNWFNALAYTSDGRSLAAAHENGAIYLIDMANVQNPRIRWPSQRSGSRCKGVAISPDNRMAASCHEDGRVVLWPLPDGKPTERVFKDLNFTCVVFTRDGKDLLLGCRNGAVLRWRWETDPEPKELGPFSSRIYRVAVSPIGDHWAACCGSDGNVILDGETLPSPKKPTAAAHPDGFLAFSPDGRLLATAHTRYAISIWDVANRTVVRTLLPPKPDTFSHGAFSPDGGILAVGAVIGPVVLWDTKTWQAVERLPESEEDVQKQNLTSLAYSPDGHTLATYRGSELKFWDVSAFSGPPKAGAWRPLFNGKDLDGLTLDSTIVGGKKEVIVQDGIPALQLTRWRLYTAPLGDYHLRFEVNLQGATEGGVFPIRDEGIGIDLGLSGLADPEAPSLGTKGWGCKYCRADLREGRIVGIGKPLDEQAWIRLQGASTDATTPWQRIEIIRLGDSLIYRVNGQITGGLTQIRDIRQGEETLLGKARLYFSGGKAPVLFRKIEIRDITALPPEIATAADKSFDRP